MVSIRIKFKINYYVIIVFMIWINLVKVSIFYYGWIYIEVVVKKFREEWVINVFGRDIKVIVFYFMILVWVFFEDSVYLRKLI